MLLVILIAIVIVGYIFTFIIQDNKIEDRQAELDELNKNKYDTEELQAQLDTLKNRASILDSILALRKFNIPMNLKQSRFYDFVNTVARRFSPISFVNIEYVDMISKEHFNYYRYRLTGTATFNDFYKIIFAIEQSKELKKVENVRATSFVEVDEDGVPHFLVNYSVTAMVYYSHNDRFASKDLVENKLVPNRLYDIFYPLIRNEIPPNTDNLLDVQTARLLALVPEGAFLSDASGNTYLLWEGDEVYLGYLTKIDYENNTVTFILNIGGIIEKNTITLDDVDAQLNMQKTKRNQNETYKSH